MSKFIFRFSFLFAIILHWINVHVTSGIKPCILRSGGVKIDSINACRYIHVTGQTVLIDFRSAAWSLAPSCSCKIRALDSGFVTFAVLNAPKDDDCNSMVSLTSPARESTSKFRCGHTNPTRVAFTDDPEVFTLRINKMSTQKYEVQSEFCIKVNGPLVDVSVQCSPDLLPLTPKPNVTTSEPTFTTTFRPTTTTSRSTTTTDRSRTTTDTVSTSQTVNLQSTSPNQTGQSILRLVFTVVPSIAAAIVVAIVIIIAVICIIKRNRTKNGSNYPPSCNFSSYSANSQYVGIPNNNGGDTLRSYEQLVSNAYLTMVGPDSDRLNAYTNGHGSVATNYASHTDKYVHENLQNHIHGSSAQSSEKFTSDYETNENRADDENVYDVIQDVVYANVTDSEPNQRHDTNEVVNYNKVSD